MTFKPSLIKKGCSLFKMCPACIKLNESSGELARCAWCQKAFLPLNYSAKVDNSSPSDYFLLFALAEELCDEDLIKGLYVLW
jgi:hypothetical protein